MADLFDHLKSLHTALIDSQKGYEEALADADAKGLTTLFREMIDLRARHHRELDRLLQESGQTPNEGGSFMSSVHRTIIKVRSVLTGLDESILPGLIDGEKRILRYYDEVEGPAAAISGTLSRQRQEIALKIAEMEQLKRA